MRLFALATAIAISGCDPANGPLDHDTLVALARSKGDASGTTHTGIWNATFYVIEGCSSGLFDFLGGSDEATVPISVVEGDGRVVMGVFPLTLSGPSWQGGGFSGAFVGTSSLAFGQAHELVRFDGEFDALNRGDVLEGDLYRRVSSEVVELEDECTSHFAITASRQ